MASSQMIEICNKYILPDNNQIPSNYSKDEIAKFIEDNYDAYFSKNEQRKAIQSKIDLLSLRNKNIKESISKDGIILPSGTHYILTDKNWALQKNHKETAFTNALKKDKDRITAYSNASVSEAFAEAFAFFIMQPKITKETSANLYDYFKSKLYKTHVTNPICK
jgi:hypothetical protein